MTTEIAETAEATATPETAELAVTPETAELAETPEATGTIETKGKISPVHPGEILMEEFIKPLGISQYRLCKDITVQPRRINQIVHGERSITAETALRLSRYFGTSERFWMNLQIRYDLEMEKDRLGDRLHTEIKEFVADPVDEPAYEKPTPTKTPSVAELLDEIPSLDAGPVTVNNCPPQATA
jgi:addiction module HigA family antidote